MVNNRIFHNISATHQFLLVFLATMKLKLTMSEIFPDDREAIARLLEPYLKISCDHEKMFPHRHGMNRSG